MESLKIDERRRRTGSERSVKGEGDELRSTPDRGGGGGEAEKIKTHFGTPERKKKNE